MIRQSKGTLFITLLAAMALAGPLGAESGRPGFRAQLSGYDEVPAVSSTGAGSFSARLAGDGASLDYTLSYRALEGTTTTGAHIHLAQAGANGGVSAFLCGGGGAPDCPPVEGSVSGTIGADQVIGPAGQGIDPGEFDELIAAMRAGATYVNVHSDKHVGGEIRGQVK